jgi:hypothetical protein
MIEGRKNTIKRVLLVSIMYGLIYLIYLVIKPEPECNIQIIPHSGEKIKCKSYKYEDSYVNYITCDGDKKKIYILDVLLIKKDE